MSSNKETRAKYREENRDKLQLKSQQYQLKNAEKLRDKKREAYRKDPNRYKDAVKRYTKSIKGKLALKKSRDAWKINGAKKIKVYEITHKAVRDGVLSKLPCEICGDIEIEFHHEDYDRPLKVNWLCKKHHMERHRAINDLKRQLDANSSLPKG